VADKRRRILGDEHPDTISAINNASMVEDLDKLDQAIASSDVIVLRMWLICGEAHPHTKVAEDDLAGLRFNLTNREDAEVSNRKKTERRSVFSRLKQKFSIIICVQPI
jgi:hypothetical protein